MICFFVQGIPDEKEEQYRVSVDWVIESEDYNEWMCEEDYEVESNGEPKVNLILSNRYHLRIVQQLPHQIVG